MNKGGRTREQRTDELMLYIVCHPTERNITALGMMFKVSEWTVWRYLVKMGIQQSKKPINCVG